MAMKPYMLVRNESIRKAAAILVPKVKIMGLNPIFDASFTPKESTESVMSPRKGNTIESRDSVTVESYYFRYEAM
jgi:hypothetical protein